jgi:hypothetical protein
MGPHMRSLPGRRTMRRSCVVAAHSGGIEPDRSLFGSRLQQRAQHKTVLFKDVQAESRRHG